MKSLACSAYLAVLVFAGVARGNVTTAIVTSGEQSKAVDIVHAPTETPPAASRGWAFVLLPTGLHPAAGSQGGVVILTDGTSYYRWRGGAVEVLGGFLDSSTPWMNPADGQTYAFGDPSIRFNARGESAVCWEAAVTWRDGDSMHYGELNVIKRWTLGEVSSEDFAPPLFVYQGSASRYSTHIFHKAIARLHAYDDSGTMWATVGLEVVPFDIGSWRLRQGVVRIDRNGAMSPTKLQAPDVQNGTSFVLNGVNGAGTAIGHVVTGGTKTFYVGDSQVDFDARYISKNGWMLGFHPNGDQFLRDPAHALVSLPADGTVGWVDDQDRLNGHYMQGKTYRRALWLRRTDSSGVVTSPVQYDRRDYLPLRPPASWTTNHEVAPGSRSLQVGILARADGNGETRGFIAVPAALAVDGNRDGRIELSPEGAGDEVTYHKPYRVWINDDDDEGPAAGNNMPGQPANLADYNNTTVDSIRDLVDFFPVYLDIKQLLGVLPHTTAGITYKLKQADGALNFVYTNLTNEYLPTEKRSKAFDYQYKILTTGFGPSFTQAAAEATTEQITAAGVRLNTAFLDGIKNNDWGVILVEARTVANPTHAPLRLVVEKEGVGEIAEVAVDIKIGPVEKMFRHVNLTAQVQEYDAYGSDNYITPPKPGVPTTTAQPVDYPDSLTNGKYFVFIHGFNVDADSARGWNAEVFKRMHAMGSKARFVGVQWNGSPPSRIPGKYLDYHKAVFQAFQTGDLLANALSFTNDADLTVAAHSLGNVITSHAIQNGGFMPTRYYMINAASPIEAYSLSDAAEQFDVMRHKDWVPYAGDARLYASKWHELFESTPGDKRNALTWKKRFENIVMTSGLAHNFFSGEEDVVADGDEIDSASILEIIVEGDLPAVMAGEYSWKLQELVKGAHFLSSAASAVLERRQGGWGLSNEWNVLVDIDPGPGRTWISKRRPTNDTGSISSDGLKTEPFFRRFLEADLMSADAAIASNKAAEEKVQYDVLARAIPAMSNAVAANPLGSLGNNNYNMPAEAKKNGWHDDYLDAHGQLQKGRNRWLHSDFCYVALPYVYPMFQEMISRGGLNQ